MRPSSVRLERIDAQQRIALVRYFYAGDAGQAARSLRRVPGRVVRPLYAKIRDLTYFGRVLVRERIVWLPATDEIRVFLDGRQMPIDLGQESDPIYAALPDPTWRRLTRHRRAPAPPTAEPTSDVPAPAAQVAPTRRRRPRSPLSKRLRRLRKRISRPTSALPRLRNALTRRAEPSNSAKAGPLDELNLSGDAELRARAKSDSVCARYRRAWTFIDRDTEAHDNAEHLLLARARRPTLNASNWLPARVGRLGTAGGRGVPARGVRQVQNTFNCCSTPTILISSQVDHYIVRPLDFQRAIRQKIVAIHFSTTRGD